VVGGGAYVAGKHMARNKAEQQQQEADQDQRIGNLEDSQAGQQTTPYATPPPAPAAPAAAPSMSDQIQQISTLHQQGVLTDEEFAAAKAKILGI
jgi:hypothetical protein